MQTRWTLTLATLCGCSRLLGFESPEVSGASDAAGDTPIGPAGIANCADSSGDDRILCMDFEGNFANEVPGTGGPGTTGTSFVPGVRGLAAQFTASSSAVFADAPIFDVAHVTIEAWINPAKLPTTATRMGIWDTQDQYGLFVIDVGLSCRDSLGGLDVEHELTIGQWTHVACVSDGTKMVMYVDGVERGVGSAMLSTAGTLGPTLGMNAPSGDNFVGAIDLLRIYREVRSAAEICASAGCL